MEREALKFDLGENIPIKWLIKNRHPLWMCFVDQEEDPIFIQFMYWFLCYIVFLLTFDVYGLLMFKCLNCFILLFSDIVGHPELFKSEMGGISI